MERHFISDKIQVRSLLELDALVGERVVGEEPAIYWEESYAGLRFDSLDEALDALGDPYFQRFIPEAQRNTPELMQVRRFAAYSTKMSAALQIVERLSEGGKPLRLKQAAGRWFAAFGENSEVDAESAPVAICLAALRDRAVEVQRG